MAQRDEKSGFECSELHRTLLTMQPASRLNTRAMLYETALLTESERQNFERYSILTAIQSVPKFDESQVPCVAMFR